MQIRLLENNIVNYALKMHKQYLKILENAHDAFNQPAFIANDPVSIPHQFTLLQDIEITGFFAAIFAWGKRSTIINKCNELISRMNNKPYSFIKNLTAKNLQQLEGFKHRTFNDTDLLYFVQFLHYWYTHHHSLECAFSKGIQKNDNTIENGLNHFKKVFFSLEDAPARTFKHISSPLQKSACKRLNMYLRWMVRKDNRGVDFGLWSNISPSQLVCPLDVHVDRTARQLGLITRTQSDWQAALELTSNLRKLNNNDPVRYDFALFGLSINPEVLDIGKQ
jgi:uncharacterized protein (TIGR02757 family)